MHQIWKRRKGYLRNIYDETDVVASDVERDNEISQLEAGLAGIASGVLKIPEGFISLGAELMDATGMSQNAAARVEAIFDKINPFEEIAIKEQQVKY